MQTVQHPTFPDVTQTVENPDEWTQQGWIQLSGEEAEQVAHDHDPSIPVRPAGNASREDWFTYAMAQPGADEGFWTGLNRDEIRDKFTD